VKRAFIFLIIVSAAVVLSVACSEKPTETAEAPRTETQKTPDGQTMAPKPEPSQKAGNVLETMNSGGYTYVMVDTGSEKIWAATPEFSVKVGDSVVIPEGMPMYNFHSTTLNRTFEMVYFVPAVSVNGAAADLKASAMGQSLPQMPPGHPPTVAKSTVDFSGIDKAQGGLTVSEVLTGKSELAGKEVILRAKVVKFMAEIMGKNWIHVQDGTGSQGTNDLTVTVAPQIVAKVGDTVLVKGIVTTDKDFGYGYRYDVILEDAQLTIE
jgi:hypothetical protein